MTLATVGGAQGEIASVPFTEDFEAPLGAVWTVSGTGTFRTQLSTENEPRGGAQHLLMDSSAAQSNARNELTIAVDLADKSQIELSFFAKEFSDENHSAPPSPFLGGADFDGVAVSVDGTTWYSIFDFPSGFPAYSQFIIDLDAAIAAHGLTYNDNFRIRFNHFDNSEIPTDGIAIDDLSIGQTFVAGVASLPFLEDFEAPLGGHWTITGEGPGRAVLTSDFGPQEGAQHFVSDSSESGIDALNELTLTINLKHQSNMLLKWWAKEFGDESQSAPIAPFVDHFNFDGIAISTGGIIWYPVLRYPEFYADYTEFTVDLDAAIAAHGIGYTDKFLIRFVQFDNGPVDGDGIVIDNIRVFSDNDPEIVAIHPSGAPMINGDSLIVFETTETGSSSTFDVTIQNTGSGALTDLTTTLDGEQANDFAVWIPPTSPVPPGGNTTMTIQFVPTTVGLRETTLRLHSNDPDNNPFVFLLKGNASSGTDHNLTLPAQSEQSGFLNVPLRAQPRTIQYIYDQSLLGALTPGATLTGMSFRINGGGSTWPSEDVTFANFDVQVSTSNNPAGQLDSAFGENIADDAVMVRSGLLTFLKDAFSAGSSPNHFGPPIPFDTPYTYNGGDLLITIRHTGNGFTQGLVDAASDQPGITQGIWSQTADAYTAVTTQDGGRSPVTEFRFVPPRGQFYAQWNSSHFEAAQLAVPGISGPGADPENDQVRNLLEYIFDLDPNVPNPSPWQVTTEMVGPAGFLKVTFRIPENFAQDASLLVEESQTLGPSEDWTTLASKEGAKAWTTTNESDLIQAPASGGRIEITVRSPTPVNDPNQSGYLRLRALIP
jgi:hypothetical protein